MLERIIPPGFTAAMLPEPNSRGAQLTLHYCVQCHNLANPAMHDAERWSVVVRRMVPRMEGKGNMGKLMAEMMAGVEAPSLAEEQAIAAYHRKHAQRPLDPKRFPDLNSPAGVAFRSPAASAMRCRTRGATAPRPGPRWWHACRRTCSG